MPREQLLIGIIIAGSCLAGLWCETWLLTGTRKGGWLVRQFGLNRARWVLRFLLFAGIIFGGLLAANVIRPLRW
jgi:hypothetical protein